MFSALPPGARVCARALVLGLVVVTPSLPPRARRLNAPLPSASLGDVKAFHFVPGQERVLYVADRDLDEVFELYSRDLAAPGPAVRLNTPLNPQFQYDVEPDFRIDPTGSWVVYRYAFYTLDAPVDGSRPEDMHGFFGTFSPDGERVVYAAPTGAPNGLRSTTELNTNNVSISGPPDQTREMHEFEITPDSMSVVFRSDQAVNDRYEVFRTPIDGSSAYVSLSGSALATSDVTSFRMSADGAWIVFRLDQDVAGKFELFRAPVDGSQARARVTPTIAAGKQIDEGYRIAPDGARVVYLAALASTAHELYSVPLLGPASATKLSVPLAPLGTVADDFQISADSSRVVYRADPEGDGTSELFSARLDGATPPVKLVALAPGEALGRVALTPDSTRAVFLRAGAQQTLESVPLDGSSSPVPLHPPLVAGGDVLSFELAGNRVVYRADQELDEVLELYSAPADASAPAVRLHEPLASNRGVQPGFEISSDGQWVGFVADLVEDERFELFRAPVDGSAPAELASDPAVGAPVPVGNVWSFRVVGDRVAYIASDAYSAPLDGSSEALRLGPPSVVGGGAGLFVASDDERVFYTGDLDEVDRQELYGAPADGSSPQYKLNPPLAAGGDVRGTWLTADGQWMVFTADAFRDEQLELFSARADGSAPALRLDPATRPDFGDVFTVALSPDSRTVAYGFDRTKRGQVELFAVPIDGSAPARKLSGTMVQGGDVTGEQFSADSTRVVYRADQELDGHFELYSRPADGSGQPKRLNPPLVLAADVGQFEVCAGGRVVFAAPELYRAPVDGSAAAQRFFPGTNPPVVSFWPTPERTRVLILAETGPVHRHQLFVAPVDGSTPPVALFTFPSVPTLSPMFVDEDTLILSHSFAVGCFRVTLDGSAPPVLLDLRAPEAVSADGRELLLIASPQTLHPGLFLMPIDGISPAREISRPLPPFGYVYSADFAGDGSVVYLATQLRASVQELFVTGTGFDAPRSSGPSKPGAATTVVR